jgi:phage baseplate assembly protein W
MSHCIDRVRHVNKDFLGRGWKFPVKVDACGNIAISQHEQNIREAMEIILSTAKGERVMQPDFGCGIFDFTFAALNTATAGMIEASVREALTLWEPRMEVDKVDVSADKSEEGKIIICINYKVRATNNEFNLVYPFYLKE